MEMQTSTLKQILTAASKAEEQPPLLSQEEILEILREAERKKASPVPIVRSNVLPRIWKITAAALSAAAIVTLFIRILDNEPNDQTIVQTSQQEQGTVYGAKESQANNNNPEQTSDIPKKLEHGESAQSHIAELPREATTAAKKSERIGYASASGGYAAPPPVIAMDADGISNESEEILKKNNADIESVVTPDHIEPIVGIRINEPETALGIAFDEYRPSVQKSEESLQALSSNRLFTQRNSIAPASKEERTLMSKNSLGADDKIRRDADNAHETTQKSKRDLIETLMGATVNPQMVTLVRNEAIVANEWASAEAEPDQLQPVYVPLKDKNLAKGIADYALLWLPRSVQSSAAQNKISVDISPNPVEKHNARLSIYISEEVAVSIAMYDMFGKKVRDIEQAKLLPKGIYHQDFTADAPDGIYVIVVVGANGSRLASGRFVIERIQDK